MIGRFTRDETGIAMGLAIIVVVIVGVMGAGLLVFVRNDLEAVVQVNQGQQAFEAADAGAQAAKRQLAGEACLESYDGAEAEGGECEESEWSYWSESEAEGYGGKSLYFDGKDVEVEIRRLEPATEEDQAEQVCSLSEPDTCYTPEQEGDYPESREYFQIVSTGHSGNGAAQRKVEAIFYTSKLDVPTSYYTPDNIEFAGNVNVEGVSFFAGGNIEGAYGESVTFDRSTPALYGDWDSTKFDPSSNYNTTPRENGAGQAVEGAGLGAEGWICKNNCSNASDSEADGINDYDSETATEFIRKNPLDSESQLGSEISYPFASTNDINDVISIELLRELAIEQGNYEESPTNIDNDNHPGSDSNEQTVFFVDAKGDTGNLQYTVNTVDDDNKAEGIIVVKDGNLKISNSSNGFNGIIIITGDGENTGIYESKGNETVEGFVIADGGMTIRGTVAPLTVDDFTNRPGFFGVETWSWRELYE